MALGQLYSPGDNRKKPLTVSEHHEAMNDNTTSSEGAQASQVICGATRDGAVRLFIIAAMLLGFGIYCFTDWSNPKYAAPESWDMKHINNIGGYLLTHYGPFVLIPPGLIVAGFAVRSLRRKLIADEEGIGYVGKEKLAWSSVTGLDPSDLAQKQILRLKHGGDKSLDLDGYDLQNFKELVAFIESHVPREQENA